MLVYILFIIGFLLLIKGGDYLVSGSSTIAKSFGISDLIIGLTVVSFGTSAPELIVNVLASIGGSADIAIGNVLGSNIANILLIVGCTAVLCDLPLKRDTLLSEIPFSVLAIVLVGFLANASLMKDSELETISRLDGGILLIFFALFMTYVFYVTFEDKPEIKVKPHELVVHGKNSEIDNSEINESEINKSDSPKVDKSDKSDKSDDEDEELTSSKAWLYIAIGMIALFIGGKWVVDGAIHIARIFGLTERLIGLTVIAIGTSLPELVTSIIAAKKGAVDIAIGNAIGSNIFNLLWILGISSIIKPLPFQTVNNIDIVILMIASSLLILSLATGKRRAIDRNDGILFLVLYTAYLVFCIYNG